MTTDQPGLDVEEMIDYVISKLKNEGLTPPRDLISRIFSIEEEFMSEKGIIDDF